MDTKQSATAVVEQLNTAELQRRIEANEAERKALLILLRAARAKDRKTTKGATDAK
jgi:hypothetical protein